MEAVIMVKSDKMEILKIIISSIAVIFTAIILYVVMPLKTEVKDLRQELNTRFDKHEMSQENNSYKLEEKFYSLYETLRKETTTQYNQIKDQLIAMLKDKKALN
jgi:hypothetical protein